MASDESEFFDHLAKYGVTVTRSGKDYSYLHPEKSKAIRGQKLGNNYTKREVLSVIEKYGNRTGGYAVGTVAENPIRISIETENGLLKEALAISNEKCNGLIGKQNMLIEDLTTSVNEIKSDNSFYLKRQSENVQSAVKEIREITQDERKFKAEVSQTIKSEIGRTVADAKAHALEQVDETLSEIKEQLKSTAKEIEREREDMKLVHDVRKFMFWATPVLLFVQTITLIFLLLN